MKRFCGQVPRVGWGCRMNAGTGGIPELQCLFRDDEAILIVEP
jgi:hypothetical protein